MDELSTRRTAREGNIAQPGSAEEPPEENRQESPASAVRRRQLYWKRMADGAIRDGTMKKHSRTAALAIAAQIARLEVRFEAAYAQDDEEGARKAHCAVGALEQMGRAEKHLADLKGRFFEMAGLDRMLLARTQQIEGQGRGSGEITLEVPDMAPPPLQQDWEGGG